VSGTGTCVFEGRGRVGLYCRRCGDCTGVRHQGAIIGEHCHDCCNCTNQLIAFHLLSAVESSEAADACIAAGSVVATLPIYIKSFFALEPDFGPCIACLYICRKRPQQKVSSIVNIVCSVVYNRDKVWYNASSLRLYPHQPPNMNLPKHPS
jgi:hypothetical protein